ncbi:MAG: efflux RND transporter periplasmic adaptor subunit [Armatimonadetes bacterium]|nr:efflux RND transporter periplasmic adaptor subunit [Armatimonadota bacterium]MBX3107944.1 efflux RND transporter periplasmic adaptor subunit [Fimbriimonadaceae bacterium]
MKKSLLIGFAFLAFLAIGGCVDRQGQQQAKKVEEIVTDPSVPVEVLTVAETTVPRTLELTGQVVTDDDVQISVKAPGRLAAVYVREGSTVSAGQVVAVQEGREAQARLSQALANQSAASASLRQAQRDAQVAPERSSAAVRASEARVRSAQAALDKAIAGARSEEKAQAKSNVDRAKSDLELARKTLERSKRLEKEGAISTAQLEADQNRFDNAQAAYTNAVEQYNLILEATRPEDITQAKEALRQAQEQLRLDKANQKLDPASQDRVDAARAQLDAARDSVRLAQIAIEDLTIRAPMSGKVSGKPLLAGTLVSPGVPIARLIGTNGIFFEAEVPERDIAQIQPGMPVAAAIDALGDIALSGKVVSVSPLASNLGRLFTVRVSIEESAGRVKPGMFVRGSLQLGMIKDVAVLPSTVLVRDGESTSVYLVKDEVKDGKSALVAHKTQIELVKIDKGSAVVTGLNTGDRVVSVGLGTIFNGAKVVINESSPVKEPASDKQEGR